MVLEGLPVLLCNEEGLGFFVKDVGRLKSASLGFTELGSRTVVLATLQVFSTTVIPRVSTVEVVGDALAARMWLLEDMQFQLLSKLGLQTSH